MRLSALLLLATVALDPARLTAAAVGKLDLTGEKGAPVAGGAGLSALRRWLGQPAASQTQDIPSSPLTQAEAAVALDLVWNHWRTQQAALRPAGMRDNVITVGAKKMRLLIRVFGTAPAGGRSLWISLHGGGGTPAQVNDQLWQNQLGLYQPAEGIYIAPRAPTNHWNLWQEDPIDDFIDRLIEDCVLLKGVNPDKSDRLHNRFYWLALPEGVARPGLTIRAGVERNVITVDAPDVTRVILRLHDRLVDLDQALKVRLNGRTVFEGKVTRQADAILKSLQQRGDPHSAATAVLEVREK